MFREAVTTHGYVVGNFDAMPSKPRSPNAARRPFRRTYIREWREFRGLTQEQLADAIDRTKATVSRIETGDIAYTREFLEAAADTLGTHPGILLMRPPTEADAYPVATGRPQRKP